MWPALVCVQTLVMVRACLPGEYLAPGTFDECLPCKQGTYNLLPQATECQPCKEAMTCGEAPPQGLVLQVNDSTVQIVPTYAALSIAAISLASNSSASSPNQASRSLLAATPSRGGVTGAVGFTTVTRDDGSLRKSLSSGGDGTGGNGTAVAGFVLPVDGSWQSNIFSTNVSLPLAPEACARYTHVCPLAFQRGPELPQLPHADKASGAG